MKRYLPWLGVAALAAAFVALYTYTLRSDRSSVPASSEPATQTSRSGGTGVARRMPAPSPGSGVPLATGSPTEALESEADAGATIRGRITRADGSALEGALVKARPSGIDATVRTARSDRAGAYVIGGLTEGTRYRITAAAEGFTEAAGEEPEVEATAPAEKVDFSLSRTVSLVLHVTDSATGESIESFLVSVQDTAGTRVARQARPGDTPGGTIAMQVLPDVYTLRIRAAGYSPFVQREMKLDDPASPTELADRLHRLEGVEVGGIRVIARDESGSLASRVRVRARRISDDPIASRLLDPVPQSGKGEIQGLEVGKYRVRVFTEDLYGLPAVADREVRANETTVLEVVVRRGGKITVHAPQVEQDLDMQLLVELRGPGGEALLARLGTREDVGGSMRERLFSERTTSEALEPGRYTLIFTSDGFAPATESVDVRRGEESLVRITLTPAR